MNLSFMPTGLSQIKGGLHSNPDVGGCAESLAIRIAISGDTPAWPLISLESVVRLTPRTFAASVTERENGSRQLSRADSPGWGGFFIGIASSSFS
jgi:hypothetical protein